MSSKNTANKTADAAPKPVKLYYSIGRMPAKKYKPVSTIGLANHVADMAA